MPLPRRPEHQRAEAAAVDHGVQGAPGADHQAVGSLDLLQRIADLLLDGRGLGPGDQVHQHLGIRRGGEDGALLHQLALDLRRVGQVAVVGDGEGAAASVGDARLGVGEHRAAGGGIPGVAHRHVTRQPAQDRLVEVLGDQPHAAMRPGHPVAIHRDDAGALLAPVLQGVEAEIGETGRVGNAGHADDAAHAVMPPPSDPRRAAASDGESPRNRSAVENRCPS